MDPPRAIIFSAGPTSNYEHAHSGDAPPSQNFSVPLEFMHACVCSPQLLK